LETHRKEKYRKTIRWLLVDLAVASIIFALLLYKPSRYNPLGTDPAGSDPRRVHPYMTYLSSEFYNSVQLEKPFELIVFEEGINETIRGSKWPLEAEGVKFSIPAVLFVPENIILMGTANIRGAEFVITIVLEPTVDQQGLLNLQVDKIKIGAMNITPLAKIIAKKMYKNRLATEPIDIEDLRAKIAGALLNDEPFDPVFKIDDKKARIEKITIMQGKLILHWVPA
jgi:hypothetical protein